MTTACILSGRNFSAHKCTRLNSTVQQFFFRSQSFLGQSRNCLNCLHNSLLLGPYPESDKSNPHPPILVLSDMIPFMTGSYNDCCHQFTPWNTILLEKLAVTQSRNTPQFSGINTLYIVLPRSILLLSHSLCLDTQTGLFLPILC